MAGGQGSPVQIRPSRLVVKFFSNIFVPQESPQESQSPCETMYATLLPVYERVLDPGHPDTLAVYANLAYWTGRGCGRGP